MKLRVRIPTPALDNLKVLLDRPQQSVALHIGADAAGARMCLEHSVADPKTGHVATVVLSYRIGTSDSKRTCMHLVESPEAFLAWARSLDICEFALDYASQVSGFVTSLEGDTSGTVGTVVESRPIAKYDIPADLPFADDGNPSIVYDAQRWAGMKLSGVPGSMLMVDMAGEALDRDRFLRVIQAVVCAVPPSGGWTAHIAPKTKASSKEKESKATMNEPTESNIPEIPEIPEIPDLPEIPSDDETDLASEPVVPSAQPASKKRSSRSRKQAEESAAAPAEGGKEPCSEPKPPEPGQTDEDAPESDAPPAAGKASETAPDGDDEEEVDDDTEDTDDGDGANDAPASDGQSEAPRKRRRKSADLDKEALDRLVSRGYIVLEQADRAFSWEGSDAAGILEKFRSCMSFVEEYSSAMRCAFLNALEGKLDSSRAVASLKERLAAMMAEL